MTRSVYFARCFTAKGVDMHAIKIGCSFDFEVRLTAVACNQPYDCQIITTCPGSLFEEAVAHLWLKPHRIGGEYFHDEPEVMDFVNEVASAGRFPLRLAAASDYLPDHAEATAFMARHGLSVADLAIASGAVSTASYSSWFNRKLAPNRRMIAAMMCAALRKGHRVNWLADLKPLEDDLAAA